MDEHGQVRERLRTARATLSHVDARQRDFCADDLGDLLDSAYLSQADAERVVGWLVERAVSDVDYAVRESALHAVSNAGVRYKLPYSSVEPLAAGIDAFEPLLLEYVLFSLSATHDPAARPIIEPFLGHPDAAVREEAALAMAELRGAGGGAGGPGRVIA
ncbi:hypothetical protein OG883_37985 [Streptomyces sp. NBC_01142]|uniref:HEAT repeat domain-containing protein n=1 Tax=Streptomyces sp. NBC_01142 TaxID=2975865 RepID=UPI0022560561|nr:hypothetical protein [Streptomyces sp. NBC_01142]MCX4825544.1 hypothetical protein [Streptomyces sp. NBC_01142]